MVGRGQDNTEMKPDYQFSQSTVVGNGRIGHFLQAAASSAVITRSGGGFSARGPIIICVRNKDLKAIIETIPQGRLSDVVLVQNGMIDDLIAEALTLAGGSKFQNTPKTREQDPFKLESLQAKFRNESRGEPALTRGILYFAVEKKGDKPVDGGGTVFTGPHAAFMVALLGKENIEARAVDFKTFQIEMGKKLIWNSVFGLLGEIYQCSVAEILANHQVELGSLILELAQVFETSQNLSLGEDLGQFLVDYAKKVGFYQTRVSEWEFRNGWFLGIKKTPLHEALAHKYRQKTTA